MAQFSDASSRSAVESRRNFRLDRIAAPTMLDETFEDEAGKALRDMLARYGPEAVRLIDS